LYIPFKEKHKPKLVHEATKGLEYSIYLQLKSILKIIYYEY